MYQGCQIAKFDPFLSLDCASMEGWSSRILHHKVVGKIYFSISISRETLDFPVQHPVWPHTVPNAKRTERVAWIHMKKREREKGHSRSFLPFSAAEEKTLCDAIVAQRTTTITWKRADGEAHPSRFAIGKETRESSATATAHGRATPERGKKLPSPNYTN